MWSPMGHAVLIGSLSLAMPGCLLNSSPAPHEGNMGPAKHTMPSGAIARQPTPAFCMRCHARQGGAADAQLLYSLATPVCRHSDCGMCAGGHRARHPAAGAEAVHGLRALLPPAVHCCGPAPEGAQDIRQLQEAENREEAWQVRSWSLPPAAQFTHKLLRVAP